MSQSTLYAGNNYYVSWCFQCVNELYSVYRNECGLGDRGAIQRVCSKIDVYWSQEVYQRIEVSPANTPSRMSDYLKQVNFGGKYKGRTYDDTLAEQAVAAAKGESESHDEADEADIVDPALVDFWGEGLSPAEYTNLQKRYDGWISTGKYQSDDPAVQTLLRQICVAEYDIAQGRAEGKAVDKQQATLNTYLGSLNAKPSQQKEAPSGLDSLTFGTGIQKWEMTRPIPEPADEWKDVDGIVKYVTVWFIGHLCHMLKIENRWSGMYEDEIRKYTVNKPEYDEDSDTEEIFDDLFGGDGQ